MPWTLEITRPAKKDLADIAESDRRNLSSTFDRLLEDLGSVDLAKLGGRQDEWRLRVGRWRVILELDKANGRIRVLRILPRGRAYR